MKNALRNLVLVLIAVAIGLGTVWIYLRGKALSDVPKTPFAHPFRTELEASHPAIVAWGGGRDEWPENTLEAFQHASELGPHVILWADVRPTHDGTLVVFGNRDLEFTTEGHGWVSYTEFSAIEKLDAGYKFKDAKGATPFRGKGLRVLTLKELLEKFPTRFFVICVRDNQPGVPEKIIAVIDETKSSDRILFASPEDGLMRDLREKKPTWLYGTSLAQNARLEMFSQFALEPVIPMTGDIFVVAPFEGAPKYHLTETIAREVHRRKMKIIIGPPSSADDLTNWRAIDVDAILTGNPSALIK